MKSNFISHITKSLPDDEFMAKIFKSEESALEVITDVACYCFDESFRNNEIIKQIEDEWNAALKVVINRIAEAMQDSYKKSVNDAELAKAIDYADENSLAEFFKTFQELQHFFHNDEKYDTEDKLEMHKKMVELYQRMIQHVDI